jgi:L-alanine-DL-glutamate epimerase-like enolase superfamily enzyme
MTKGVDMSLSRKQVLRMIGFGALAAGAPLPGAAAKSIEPARQGSASFKITGVEIYLFDLPLAAPFRIAIGEMTAANDILVRVHTDQGITGLGEACPFPPITGETQAANAAAAVAIRDMVVGRDALAADRLLRRVGPIVHSNPSAVAAYDMAFFDILGQAAGLPLYRLFGGDRRTFETDITVGLDAPEAMAREAARFLDLGYRTIKAKVGLDPDEDAARVRAVREAVGPDVRLRIDANQGWTVPQAIDALRKMEKFRVQFVEQPVVASDTSGLRTVRNQSPIPVMADEACFLPPDAIRLIRAEACDYFNIKLMKAGGILNAVRIAHVADAAGMKCMVGCMLESKVALTAAAHVVASQDNVVYADLDGNAEHTADPVAGGFTIKGGMLTLTDKPGLGCDVDPAFLGALRKV